MTEDEVRQVILNTASLRKALEDAPAIRDVMRQFEEYERSAHCDVQVIEAPDAHSILSAKREGRLPLGPSGKVFYPRRHQRRPR